MDVLVVHWWLSQPLILSGKKMMVNKKCKEFGLHSIDKWNIFAFLIVSDCIFTIGQQYSVHFSSHINTEYFLFQDKNNWATWYFSLCTNASDYSVKPQNRNAHCIYYTKVQILHSCRVTRKSEHNKSFTIAFQIACFLLK